MDSISWEIVNPEPTLKNGHIDSESHEESDSEKELLSRQSDKRYGQNVKNYE